MIMADVFKIVFLVAGALVVFVSYWLAGAALFPDTVERARRQYHERPIRITGLGVGLTAPALLVGVALLQQAVNPLAKLAGAIVLAVPVLLGLLGSAGLATRIGLGLPAQRDDGHPWHRMMRGSVVLSLTFLLPVIGWFVVLPWTLVSGVGAAVAAIRGARASARSATPPAAPVASSSTASVAAG